MIEIKGLNKVFRTEEVETTAINNISLTSGKRRIAKQGLLNFLFYHTI